ncbi:hypothetical protein CVT26_009565 [Gymnopilus dilepis]|uniref:Alpha/beta hydrolase fold-3 domain-containing protein n=1 Tax=Gymnopilus dilepis TaxID=231916 RepID=A0A409VKB3_9AGAR|nr:hypothetical protein CVT26_009565 [Gymnopilus dilepis]
MVLKAVPTKPYGKVTWLDKIKLLFVMLPLPLVTIADLLLYPFRRSQPKKTWKRILTDSSFRYISSRLSVPQMQYVMGTTVDVYKHWAKQNKMEEVIDEIGMDARLLWFGERRTEKVILYVHGGTYCLPLQDFAASFWKYAKETIEKDTNTKIGFVALNYSLVPTAYFPTQLKQLVHALQYLHNNLGVPYEQIHIAGESAGGALTLQLLSHILHPLEDVPTLELRGANGSPSKLGGALIMSPWVSITGDTGSHKENSDTDVLPAYSWKYLGEQTLLPLSQEPDSNYGTIKPYVEALKAPEGWFNGVDGVLKRVLVTVGEKECLRDDVVEVGKKLGQGNGDTFATTVVQKGGVHNDQYLDFMAGQGGAGELTAQVIHWLEEGLASQQSSS